MARINGEIGSLMPSAVTTSTPRIHKPRADAEEVMCPCCQQVTKMSSKERTRRADWVEEDHPLCAKCWGLYSSPAGPVIWADWQDALSLIEEARQSEWALCLTTNTFAAAGVSLSVELGDVYKVSRAGGSFDSVLANTIDVSLGGVPITLWPHEFSPIKLMQVMLMVGEGEMTNAYLSSSDDIGYWTPSKKLRRQITAMFGKGRASGIGCGGLRVREPL